MWSCCSYTTPMHQIHTAATHLVLCDDAAPQFVVVPEELRGTDPILVHHNPDGWMDGGMKSYYALISHAIPPSCGHHNYIGNRRSHWGADNPLGQLMVKVLSHIPMNSTHCTNMLYIDGFHSTFSLGNWRALHHHPAYWLVNIYIIIWPFCPPVSMVKDGMESIYMLSILVWE